MSMQVQVLFFGSLTDVTQVSSITVNDAADTAALQQELVRIYPALAVAKYLLAVNKKMVKETMALQNKDVVALMPPFSGG